MQVRPAREAGVAGVGDVFAARDALARPSPARCRAAGARRSRACRRRAGSARSWLRPGSAGCRPLRKCRAATLMTMPSRAACMAVPTGIAMSMALRLDGVDVRDRIGRRLRHHERAAPARTARGRAAAAGAARRARRPRSRIRSGSRRTVGRRDARAAPLRLRGDHAARPACRPRRSAPCTANSTVQSQSLTATSATPAVGGAGSHASSCGDASRRRRRARRSATPGPAAAAGRCRPTGRSRPCSGRPRRLRRARQQPRPCPRAITERPQARWQIPAAGACARVAHRAPGPADAQSRKRWQESGSRRALEPGADRQQQVAVGLRRRTAARRSSRRPTGWP